MGNQQSRRRLGPIRITMRPRPRRMHFVPTGYSAMPCTPKEPDLAAPGTRPYNVPQPPPTHSRRGWSAMPTPNELYDQALELRDRGDKPGAIASLEEAVATDPAFAIGHGMLAKLYA